MSSTQVVASALFLVVALLGCPDKARSQVCDASPYSYWGGYPWQYVGYGYLDDAVPYYIRHPPVYYGYSMLLPLGDGFTTRSYGSQNFETASPSRPPLVVMNPYLATAPHQLGGSSPETAAEPLLRSDGCAIHGEIALDKIGENGNLGPGLGTGSFFGLFRSIFCTRLKAENVPVPFSLW